MYIPKALRQQIKQKYGGKCAYCGNTLTKGWHVDHLEAIVRDFKYNSKTQRYQSTGTCQKPHNNTPENFNPSCASCNIQKGSYTIEQFRENIKQFLNSLNKYSTQYKFAKRYGLVREINNEVTFYFETLKARDRCISCGTFTKTTYFAGNWYCTPCYNIEVFHEYYKPLNP